MHYDLLIIGAGSAGLPAGMYASRYKLTNLIIGKEPGGALATSHFVENWPGEKGASGFDIMQKFEDHARVSGSEILSDEVTEIRMPKSHFFEVQTASGLQHTADFVLLATGNGYKKLHVPGEKEFLGSGVSYCATCDGMFFRKKKIVVVGGGDAAFSEALYLADLSEKTTLLVRGKTARAETVWIEKAQQHPKLEIRYETEIAEIQGDVRVQNVLLKNGELLPTDAVFVAVGSQPYTQLVDHLGVKKDESGCLMVDARQHTGIPGLYAAGDITTNSYKFRQTIMSAAEGCLAAHCIHEEKLKNFS